MPRVGTYLPWSSKNCARLKDDLDGLEFGDITVDFREPGKKIGGKERHSVAGGAGRPHREEAMLVQHVGSNNSPACDKCAAGHGAFSSCKSVSGIHRGACGCCIWDSKAMDCNLALDVLEVEVSHKEKMDDLKRRKRDSNKPVSSKAKRAKVPKVLGGRNSAFVSRRNRTRRNQADLGEDLA